MSGQSYFDYKIYQCCLLVVLVLLGISMGIWQQIITPTLPNLKEKLNVSYESMGKMMSIRSLGNVMTLLATGYLYDSFPTYVPYMMFGECLIAGIATIIIPWCQDFWIVSFLFYLQSGFQYALNNGGQLTILKTFKDEAVGKMQIYHLGYGVGSFLSGLIAQPFLPKHISKETKITKYCKIKLESQGIKAVTQSSFVGNVTIFELSQTGSFEYIYLISGLIAVVSAFIFLGFVSKRNPMKYSSDIATNESWFTKIQPKYIANGRTGVGIFMTILLFLYYFFYIFGSTAFGRYIVVYAIDPCKEYSMNQKTAAYLHSAANGCFLVGRILGSFIINLHPTMIILLFNSFSVVFVLILLLFSNQYAIALWIGACGMRFCNSIAYPSGTSYVNRYIIVTSTLISIAFLGSTAGEIMGPLTGGFIIDNYPSYYTLQVCFALVVTFLFTVITIAIVGKKIGIRKFAEDKILSKVADVELPEI